MHEPVAFGAWLKQRRKALDLTQATLARQVACARMTLQKIENEQRRPSADLAARLAAALEVPPEERAGFVRAARGKQSPPPQSLSSFASRGYYPSSQGAAFRRYQFAKLPAKTTSLVGRAQELTGASALLR